MNSYLLASLASLSFSLTLMAGTQEDFYSAIAVNPFTYEKGLINDATTEEEAEAFALRNCGDTTKCKIVAKSKNSDVKISIKGIGNDFIISSMSSDRDIEPRERVELSDASTAIDSPICFTFGRKVKKDYSKSDFVAIAWNSDANVTGESSGKFDRFDAEDEAIFNCKNKSKDIGTCRVVLSAKGQCIGIHTLKNNHFIFPDFSIRTFEDYISFNASIGSYCEVDFKISYKSGESLVKTMVCPKHLGEKIL